MGFFGNLNEEKYDRQYTDRYLMQRIWAYMRSYKRQLLTIVATLLVLSFIGSITPILISTVVGELQSGGDTSTLTLLIGALFVSAILEYLFGWLRRRLTSRVVARMITQMRKDAFAASVYRDLAFYDETKSGKVISRITSDTQEFGQVIVVSGDIITQFIELTVLFFVLLNRDWRLLALLLAWSPVIVGIALMFRSVARKVTRQGSRAMAAVNDQIQESVAGISVAKNFRQESMMYDEFVKVNVQSYTINLRRGFILALVFPTLNALAGGVIGSVVYAGAAAVVEGAINVGSWYLFIQSVDRFLFPFINLAAFWSQLQQGFSSAERVFALIDAENTVVQTGNEPVGKLRGKIEFQNLNFAYKDHLPVLKSFNLTIQPGESLAFVGHTGAGKSTIAKLITRFYEFQDGKLLIDGRDIRSFNIQEFRGSLGIVPQLPFLFSGTVVDNIRYGKPEATDEEIREVAYSIGGGEWLETLPKGLQTDVGERGAHLSMGQRQLVSLLRVLLQKPAVFILDEATASIDPFTETQIQDALELILSQSTSILIAHRLSTVRSADRIIVLKDGYIIEEGSHDQLMQLGGHYAELYNTYFRHQSLSYIEHSREMFSERAGD
ncbi:MAG: ABC transporter ATP-binding protein [Anaerolineae bacterium]